MDDKKDFYDIIPPDDVTIFYGEASETVRRVVSLLLQMNDRFYLYVSSADRDQRRTACALDEKSYGDVLYNVLFDFVQRYGHFQFFRILLEFLESNTHPVTAAMLFDLLASHLSDKEDTGAIDKLDDMPEED